MDGWNTIWVSHYFHLLWQFFLFLCMHIYNLIYVVYSYPSIVCRLLRNASVSSAPAALRCSFFFFLQIALAPRHWKGRKNVLENCTIYYRFWSTITPVRLALDIVCLLPKRASVTVPRVAGALVNGRQISN